MFQVLLAYEEEEIARYIYRISVHTLMSSNRDALSILDRDWISVQTTEVLLFDHNYSVPLVALKKLKTKRKY